MFKAINKKTNSGITILDSQWDDRIGDLRELDRKDLLCCQECNQPVRVRAGEVYRWHFAHKTLRDCKYGKESPALLAARSVLYRWLVGKFGASVQIEKKLENIELPRAIDCWIEEDDHKIAYWIVDSQIKPAIRHELREVFRSQNIWINWIFCLDVLKSHQSKEDTLLLSTTERDFLQLTEYDEIMSDGLYFFGKTLHYLDYEKEILVTFRRLFLEHDPQIFQGVRKESPLIQIKVKKTGGELWHPGEPEEAERRKTQIAAEKERHKLSWDQQRPYNPPSRPPAPYWKSSQSSTCPTATPNKFPTLLGDVVPTCIFCGKQTMDFWFQDIPGKCRCKECRDKGFTRPNEPIKWRI